MIALRNISYYLLLFAALMLTLNRAYPHHHHHHQVCCVSVHDMAEESGHCCETEGNDHAACEDNHDASEFCQQNSLFLISGKKDSSPKEKDVWSQKTHLTDIPSVEKQIPNPVYKSYSRYKFRQEPAVRDVIGLVRAMRGPPSC